VFDQFVLYNSVREDRLREAEQWRLAAKLPRRYSFVRHLLAAACRGLANVLDDPRRYRRTAETGLQDWVTRSAGV
jgi:hypothetical protein